MRYIAMAAGLLAASSASAQDLTEAETHVLPRLIDSICVDLIEERNGCETAVLLSSSDEPDAADLVILSDRRATDPQEILATVRGIAFNGPLFGQAPSLEQSENGSLLVHAEQIGIGRSPWTETLTLAYREGAFVVAGRTFSTYDRIALGDFSCDVNLLTGDWVSHAQRSNGETGDPIYQSEQSGRVEGARIPLAEWNRDIQLPQPCLDEMSAWWAAEPQ